MNFLIFQQIISCFPVRCTKMLKHTDISNMINTKSINNEALYIQNSLFTDIFL